MLKLTNCLLDKHGFLHILAEKFFQIPLKTVGWYKQIKRGNFFMSIQLVLYAKKFNVSA